MADNFVTVPLNLGLDLNTPALQKQPGSLVDCLNYEVTDAAGYRRLDGYEKFDGFLNGATTKLYYLDIVDPDITMSLNTGDPLYIKNNTVSVDPANIYQHIGFVVNSLLDSSVQTVQRGLIYAPIRDEYILKTGDTFYGDLSALKTYVVDVGGSVPLYDKFTGPVVLQYVREAQSRARALVTSPDTAVVGLHWLDNNLIVIKDLKKRTLTFPNGTTMPPEGAYINWNSTRYRLLRIQDPDATWPAPPALNFTKTFYLQPLSTIANVTGVYWKDATGAAVSTLSAVGTEDPVTLSEYAAPFYFPTTTQVATRGLLPIQASYDFLFDAGSYTGGVVPPATVTDNFYYIVQGVGQVLKVRLEHTRLDTNTFAAGTATGRAQVYVVERIAGTIDYPVDNDEVHNAYPTTGSSRVFTVNGTAPPSVLPGTAALDRNDSKYVMHTHNFYGDETLDRVYGATGAGRSFWMEYDGFGLIFTQETASKDMPRHVCPYGMQLALGFRSGSVQLSVLGEPLNFSGVDGAIEVSMGDPVYGLLEMQGDTLGVFCRKSIRRISGHNDSSVTREVISANQGILEYTACTVAGQPVFTTSTGISTLEQSAAYGDFIGDRTSSLISDWIRPKLIYSLAAGDSVGTLFAYPVRNKNQYRLCFRDGVVVSVAFTKKGPVCMKSTYYLVDQIVRPYCVSSQTGDDSNEHLHVVWDGKLRDFAAQKPVYELDSGWGFNGYTFPHHIDLSHIFVTGSQTTTSVEWCRLYGKSYGVASLNLKAAGIEDDFNQPYHDAIQDLSLPRNVETVTEIMKDQLAIIDTANWGLGIKLGIYGNEQFTTNTEPSHLVQVLVLQVRSIGAKDS